MPCSRSSIYQECPIIKYPRDRAAFITKFLSEDPDTRAIQLSGYISSKKSKKATNEKDAGKIHDILLDLERKRELDFESTIELL